MKSGLGVRVLRFRGVSELFQAGVRIQGLNSGFVGRVWGPSGSGGFGGFRLSGPQILHWEIWGLGLWVLRLVQIAFPKLRKLSLEP